MANINGTNLAAPIVPFTTNDTFPTHYAKYGKGGYRTVATITERDGIFTALREEGMEVYVLETGKKYTLVGGLLNTNWVESTSITPGANTQIIFNDGGTTLIGDVNLTYNKLSKTFLGGKTIRNVGTSFFLDDAGNITTTGNFNLGAGFNALKSVTSGDNNIAVGGEALNSVTTGFGNTALGYAALKNGNGFLNFGLGYEAGRDCTGINNIFLGSYAGNTETNISNRLIIETDQNRNTNKDYLIEGDFSQRWVRFNGAVRKRVSDISSTASLITGIATAGDVNVLHDTTKSFTVNEFVNKFLVITGGTGVGQVMLVASNTSIAIYTTKNFTINPDNTSTYKVINGSILLGENLNTNYYFNLTNEDYVVNLPISTNYIGGNVDFTIKTNPNSNKLYILTSGSDTILPDNSSMNTILTPYKTIGFNCVSTGWISNVSGIQDSFITNNLYSIKQLTYPSSNSDITVDLINTVFYTQINTGNTVTITVPSNIATLLTNKVYTFEFHFFMVIVSTIIWPVNVSWVGGSEPTLNSVAKYCVVLRTMDAGTTWIANLAYTY